ncbi:DnaD domain protein [Streptococcus suis]|uniref:DnaD domain protein n=1 Tax=Streptococcus suis TaxID=1307 RepID=A0A4T2H2J2_STRSU|nr:DnaD domain protein [Streptococcus suis]TII06239.1 DnaD domain protein [Streptococcus suis]
MGNRRMISKTVTQTQRFLQMPLEAQALYFHLIQNSDDDGVVEAFPVVRMIGASDDGLKLLHAKGFVTPLNHEMVYFITDFHEQNTVRKDRYHPSIYNHLLDKISEKNDGLPHGNHTATDGLPNISKDNISKDNISKGSGSSINNITGQTEKIVTAPPTLNQDFVSLYKSFEAETGKPLSPIQIQELQYTLEDFSPELILEALREAVGQGKANFAYIQAILKRWKQDNLLTVELVRNSKAAREAKKQQNKSKPEPQTREEWLTNWSEENPF